MHHVGGGRNPVRPIVVHVRGKRDCHSMSVNSKGPITFRERVEGCLTTP